MKELQWWSIAIARTDVDILGHATCVENATIPGATIAANLELAGDDEAVKKMMELLTSQGFRVLGFRTLNPK